MKRQRISETIGNINPKYIDEATEYTGAVKTAPKKIWYKWVAIAACFALVIAIGFPFAKDLFTSPDHKDITDAIMLIEYDNAYFEIIEDPKTIERFGLEKDITHDIIGKHIAFLQEKNPNAERSDFILSEEETDFELFEYTPAPHKAVRVFRDGDKYYYVMFCNYLNGQSESLPIRDAFDVFGIDESADIISITPIKTDNTLESDGNAVTDSAVIAEFYTEISRLTAFSFDEYHEAVYGDELEKYEDKKGGDVGSELYTRVADDYKEIKIETKDGLYFVIGYYPSYDWIKVDETMSYYQMSPEIKEWFEVNIK